MRILALARAPFPLMPPPSRAGTTLLHYRILRPIGSGGMGVVYEAEDTKLGRRVALKFLPPAMASDAVAMERFTREARAASALNHPNICTIYAIEEADGVHFIAMELLDGEPLDRRIANRPLSWDALVDTGIQLADAFDAAHRRGIIHRDVKPANIFLTADGRAKVLDFGVAKMAMHPAAQTETVAADGSSQALTGEGFAVGTVAYMSPEQARGEPLDARTDVFSLAAVLYETSTGRRAFEGATSAVVFSRLLEATPTAPREINPTLPPKLEDIILRGLEKDRDLRYQTAADLRADLKRLKRDASSGRLAFVPAAPVSGAAPLSSGAVLAAEVRRHKGIAGAVALLVVALTAAAAYGIQAWIRSPEPSTPAAARPANPTPVRVTTSGDVQGCGSISPDGRYVVYCTFAGKLELRQIATGARVPLGEATGSTAFSPDGDYIYVTEKGDRHPEGVLWVIGTLGGERSRVTSNLGGAVAVSPDGTRIAFVRPDVAGDEAAVIVADARGSGERRVAVTKVADAWFEESGVSWSPDGRLLSLTQSTLVGGYRMQPVIVHVDSGKVERLGTRTWAAMGRTAWLPGTSGVLFTARDHIGDSLQFWMAEYPGGNARQITSDARGFGMFSVSVTADGSAAVSVPTDEISNIWSTNADATAPLEQWTSGERPDGLAGIVPTADGRLFYSSNDGSGLKVWSVGAPGAQPRRITPEYAEAPASPGDGRFLVYQAIHEGRYRIWRADRDGAGARPITSGEDDILPSVSPDGRWVYYWTADEKNVRVLRVASDGGPTSVVSNLPVQPVGVSPDGRHLLVISVDASLKASHLVLDAASGAVTGRFDFGKSRAGWGRSSQWLTFVREQDGVGNLWEQPIAGGKPRQLTRFTSGTVFGFAYTPDRDRLFIAKGRLTGDVVIIRNFR